MERADRIAQQCAAGMQAEVTGPPGRARDLFEQAWASARDDYERCVAAHFLARQQPTPRARLEWNERCLQLAERVGDGRVDGFYPSLHLNLGRDLEELGEPSQARTHYAAALRQAEPLEDTGYLRMIRAGAQAGLTRTADAPAAAVEGVGGCPGERAPPLAGGRVGRA